MLRSLRSRLLLSHSLVAGLALSVVGVGLVIFLIRNPLAERQVYQRLDVLATLVAEREARVLQSQSAERLRAGLQRLGVGDARLLLLDRRGQVLADSSPEAAPLSAEVRAALAATSERQRGEYRDTSGARWLHVAVPVEGGRVLVVAARQPILRTLALVGEDLLSPMVRAGVVALLASVLLALLISRWISAPLQEVARAARAVAAGDYNQRLSPSGPDESHSLARAFNEMVDRVRWSQQAQRDFVANVSHELKTPLTSIQGFAQAILDGTAAGEEARRHAARVIYDESDRVRRLVEDLLDLARLDAGQMDFTWAPVDLVAIVRGVVERLRLRAQEKGLRLVTELPALPKPVGDGDRLAQVFTNLIDNAVRHTPQGGAVTVRGEALDRGVAVHVDDTGAGIPSEELSRIFERFYRVDKSRPGGAGRGAGLGLAISREIVQAHGGRLVADSIPGLGSRFSVHLPLGRPEDVTLPRERTVDDRR
jgi:signal transduction histidine kinase